MSGPPDNSSNSSDESPTIPDMRLEGRALVNTLGDGVYQLDRDGHFVAVNDALTELTGYSRDTFLGSHVSNFLDAENTVRVETAIRELLLNGDHDTIRLPLPLRTATNDIIPCIVRVRVVMMEGEFYGTVGVVREVHDQETAAPIREVGERRQAFDALAEASADGIVMLDDDSIIRYMNPAVERILGYRPEELIGKSLLTIIPEHLQQAHTEAFQQYLDTGEKRLDWTYIELPGCHKDGHEVPLALSFGDFEYGGDHYFVGTFRDISKQKETEQELEHQNERLDRFASMLAHELRNPLEIAQIYLDFIDDADAVTIDQIAGAHERMEDIIEVLLMLARGRDDVEDREAVGLTGIVEDAWTNTTTGEAQVEVTTTQILHVNPTHLQHLLENLFRNAVEHSDGPITVRAGALEDGFYVEDTGPGIPEAERESVVEAGYTTDTEGIGLGLTFVTELADAYGWEYAIMESDEGGTRFEFTNVETINDD